jgi:ATPase subunit of ABC transporter with duplicated ATPase domains
MIEACLLVLAAAGADNPFEGIEPGQRVVVHLRTNHRIPGQVLAVMEDRIVLDLSLEYPSVESCTMTLRRFRVRRVERRGDLSPEELRRRAEEKIRAMEALQAATERNRSQLEEYLAERERARQEEELRSAADRMQQEAQRRSQQEVYDAIARSIYAEFPPSEGWSEQKYVEIHSAIYNGEGVNSEREKRFYENYALWQRGRELALQGEGGAGGGGTAGGP